MLEYSSCGYHYKDINFIIYCIVRLLGFSNENIKYMVLYPEDGSQNELGESLHQVYIFVLARDKNLAILYIRCMHLRLDKVCFAHVQNRSDCFDLCKSSVGKFSLQLNGISCIFWIMLFCR